jgi:serine/threonine-protein kinase
MQPRAPEADAVREELARVLAGPGFLRNERLSSFLRFVVREKLAGREAGLKESVVGAEVFGRTPGYDTRSDPVVRMEASRLRARLDEYYIGAGADNPIRIELPKGAYVPQWRIRRGTGRRPWAAAAAAAICLLLLAGAAWRWTTPGKNPALAVLPFLNLSPDPADAYLADGLTDEITGLLARTDGLDVTARTSAFAFKDAHLDARGLAARLNATLLVEGSVQKSGDRIKVIVQLIRASDGKHLWSNSYDREMRDVFTTEEQVAASIVGALRLTLSAPPRRTANAEAYAQYLRGREAYDLGSPGLALHYFEQASSLDPSLAPAYAGIADTAYLKYRDLQSYAEAHSRATSAVEKALSLDPRLAEAYTTLGSIRSWDYAFPDAERAFRRAIALNPNDARAHAVLGHNVLAPLGRFDEAAREVRRALILDPLSSETRGLAELTMLMAGLYPDAERLSREDIVLSPALAAGPPWLALALSFQGRHAEATEVIRQAKSRAPGKGMDWMLACVAARAGRREEAARTLEENLPPLFTRPPVNRRLFAIYACLGDKPHALEHAEKAYAEHDLLLPTFLSYPVADWLRADPAFADLRLRTGLPR